MSGHGLLNLAIYLATLGWLMTLIACCLAVNGERGVKVLLPLLGGACFIFAALWFATESGRTFEREARQVQERSES